MNNPNIYIVGAGAIGKVLAVFCKQANRNVVILRGSVNDGSCYMEEINVIVNDNEFFKASIEINTLENFARLDGIIVIASKSFGNEQLAAALKSKAGNSPIVVLQNGLNVEQPFIDHDHKQIYRCVLFATSQPTAMNVFTFKPVAVSPIGIIKGDMHMLEMIVNALSTDHFLFRSEEVIQPVIWTKAIVNSIFNSICPLLEIDNGIFYKNKKALSIAERIIDECIAVAHSKNIILKKEEVLEKLLLISRSSDGQLISTYQDILHQRKTEIETLNFAIVDAATEMNGQHLIKETNLLGELTKVKAELKQR